MEIKKTKEMLLEAADGYMNRSFVLGFKTAIECIEIDIKKTDDKWKADTLINLAKRLKNVLTMYKEGVSNV